jgi:hypothetical protein
MTPQPNIVGHHTSERSGVAPVKATEPQKQEGQGHRCFGAAEEHAGFSDGVGSCSPSGVGASESWRLASGTENDSGRGAKPVVRRSLLQLGVSSEHVSMGSRPAPPGPAVSRRVDRGVWRRMDGRQTDALGQVVLGLADERGLERGRAAYQRKGQVRQRAHVAAGPLLGFHPAEIGAAVMNRRKDGLCAQQLALF